MNKPIQKTISVMLTMIVLFGTTVEAKVLTKSTKYEQPKVFYTDEGFKIETISRNEYLEGYAKEKGISIEEADRLEKLETERELSKEIESKKGRGVVQLREVVYQTISRGFTAGNSRFESVVAVSMYVKSNRYWVSGFGTYQKFESIIEKRAGATGDGYATFDPFTFGTTITNDTGYGNEIQMQLTGNVEHTTNYTQSIEASSAGFSVSNSSGGTWYCRKFVRIDFNFSSNYTYN